LKKGKINIDSLIDVVSRGGTVRTGVDIHNEKGVLLLEKNVRISSVNPLLVIKKCGVYDISIDSRSSGGIWDKNGNEIPLEHDIKGTPPRKVRQEAGGVEQRVQEITELKREASQKYKAAKKNIKKVITDIRKTGGEFDYEKVEQTVTDLISFLARKDSAFTYLTKEIFSYDDYLYNHSVNVCTIATAVIRRFNDHFGDVINQYLTQFSIQSLEKETDDSEISFIYYLPEELHDMSFGYFLHDVGKVMIPDEILNKNGKLTEAEFETVKKHSFEKGTEILKRNRMLNPYIENIVMHHHGPLFTGEQNCYPEGKLPIEIQPYVKVCKLADIYDAMTSKRSYREARNPISVVTDIYRKYAGKNRLLQFLIHSFVKIIGIFPPGSVLHLRNGQMAYIIESEGPIVLPFTDIHGKTLSKKPDPVDLGAEDLDEDLHVDRRKPLKSPHEVYDSLPSYLKDAIH
jgi:HD-GYP domain-containing protein (c-di-GMP phosphodiesterase class II)